MCNQPGHTYLQNYTLGGKSYLALSTINIWFPSSCSVRRETKINKYLGRVYQAELLFLKSE